MTKRKILSREQITSRISSDGLAREEVDVPEWGGVVLVRELTASEVTGIGLDVLSRREGDRESITLTEISDLFPMIVSYGLIDEEGNSVVTADEAKRFRAGDAAVLGRLAETVLRLSNITKQTGEAEGKN